MIEIIGIVGSIASIIALILPASSKSQRILHAVYVLIIVVVSITAFSYKLDLSKINNAEREAKKLINNYDRYTNLGFSMAALSFLEKNKDVYPDSYNRAKELCSNNDCLGNKYRINNNSFEHSLSQIDVSFALVGMLRGIGDISVKH